MQLSQGRDLISKYMKKGKGTKKTNGHLKPNLKKKPQPAAPVDLDKLIELQAKMGEAISGMLAKDSELHEVMQEDFEGMNK